MSCKEVAANMELSPKTVTTHKERIFVKTGVANDVQLGWWLSQSKVAPAGMSRSSNAYLSALVSMAYEYGESSHRIAEWGEAATAVQTEAGKGLTAREFDPRLWNEHIARGMDHIQRDMDIARRELKKERENMLRGDTSGSGDLPKESPTTTTSFSVADLTLAVRSQRIEFDRFRLFPNKIDIEGIVRGSSFWIYGDEILNDNLDTLINKSLSRIDSILAE